MWWILLFIGCHTTTYFRETIAKWDSCFPSTGTGCAIKPFASLSLHFLFFFNLTIPIRVTSVTVGKRWWWKSSVAFLFRLSSVSFLGRHSRSSVWLCVVFLCIFGCCSQCTKCERNLKWAATTAYVSYSWYGVWRFTTARRWAPSFL